MRKIIIVALRYFIICYISMFLFYPLIKGVETPNTYNHHSDKQTLNLDKTETLNNINLQKHEELKKDLNLRLFVKLIPHETIIFVKNNFQKEIVSKSLRALNHILRADLNKPNDFYISQFHIKTRPLICDLRNNKYKLKMSFYQIHYSEISDIEEFIGSVEVNGILYKDKDNIFNLYSNVKQTFLDKNNTPILQVHIGPQNLNIAEFKKFFNKKYFLATYNDENQK